jgi:2',3'-cyclic-nucleotide 2'-phosphodiesterase (5'-nucleotidase family)
MAEVLRIVTTNDFLGSFFAHATSYGRYPGANSLISTVNRLREQASALLWVDAGDFAQGGPLAAVSGGTYGFAAAAELGIDVAVPGNHEFDWGVEHLRRWGAETRFPLVLANYDTGLPPYALLPSGRFTVGVIGLTHPALRRFGSDLTAAQPAPAEIVPSLAREVRSQGADVVVAAIHDGVDWKSVPDGPSHMGTRRMEVLCGQLRGHADVVIGGHTLGRHIGELAGVPFVQPWPLGAEIGVLDRLPDGSWRTSGVMTGAADTSATSQAASGGGWDGLGAGIHAVLNAQIAGDIARPLTYGPRHSGSLGTAVARGITKITGATVSVLIPPGLTQAPTDGIFAYLPPGPVTEADILRLMPQHQIVVCELTGGELESVLDAATGRRGPYDDITWNIENLGGLAVHCAKSSRDRIVSLAMPGTLRPAAEKWIGRGPEWTRSGKGLRDAFRAAVN